MKCILIFFSLKIKKKKEKKEIYLNKLFG